MKINLTGRAMGKTTKAVLWVMEKEERLLAVFSEKEKQRIVGHFNIPQNKIIVWDKQVKSDLQFSQKEIGVDNADWIIQSFFKNPVGDVWITGECGNKLAEL